MSEAHPTAPRKPSKPYPEFPLFAHASGRWCKKIRGRQVYFGPWSDPDGALARYLEQKDALHAGRVPRPDPSVLTVKLLANLFLEAKDDAVTAGELSQRTRDDYQAATDLLVAEFGKHRAVADLGPADFAKLRAKIAGQWGPHKLSKTVRCIKTIFKFAFDRDLVDRQTRFGEFKGASSKTMRLHRASKPPKLFTAEELHKLLAAAGRSMKAMILLGINAGFGNTDCGSLPIAALNLDTGWLDFARPKTGISRRAKLWPETVAALRAVLASRPEPKEEADAGLVFITKFGLRWHKDIADSPVTKEFRKLTDAAGIKGRTFYCLRHTFQTIADEARDQVAVSHVMGHADGSMASVYRERIGDDRLEAVASHVRAWLWPRGGSN